MNIDKLAAAVDEFAAATVGMNEAQLNQPWAWRDYDSEGVRFAFFRTLEELRSLAASLARGSSSAGLETSAARLILGQYHRAWRAMKSMLLGTDEADREQVPGPNEWPLRRVIAHVVDADVGFYTGISETLKSLRAGEAEPPQITDEMWEGLTGTLAENYVDLIKGPSGPVLDLGRRMHARILDEFSSMTEEELECPSYYWEAETYPLRFRLGRFESHCRQHTIQLYKVRVAIGRPPSEAQMLLGLIYDALAEAENVAAPVEGAETLLESAAASIRARAEEVAAAIA
ncbi:MAG: DinB family protein [Anaerolineales bacterium]